MDHESTTYWQELHSATRSRVSGQDTRFLKVPGLTILSHPDTARVGERAVLTALSSWREVAISRLEPVFAVPGGSARRPLGDRHLSRSPVRLVPALDGVIRLVTSGTKTEVTADGIPISEGRDFTTTEIETGIVLLLAERITLFLHSMDPVPPHDLPRMGLVGESSGMLTIRQQVIRVADLPIPVLLRGETGTGKELVANAIHQASRRRDNPFVPINMGGVPPSLAAAELFGAAKGAFTGADKRRTGYFARAQGGTLFLDEIGETPPEVQVLLLRTLETAVIQPVGAESSEEIDVRVVAATDANLEAEIKAGRFRAPLLHRLSSFEIRLPPLRQRREDIGLLLLHFLRRECETLGEPARLEEYDPAKKPWLPASLVARLASYDWPGNVRQLRNLARQLVIANQDTSYLRLTPQVEELLAPPAGPVKETSSEAMSEGAYRLAEEASSDRPLIKTLLFTDLVESMKLVGQLGDERALEVMTRHDRAARGLLEEFDGIEIDKSDGFLLLFDRPIDAVAYALEYHRKLEDVSVELGIELEARAGVHLGEVFMRHNTKGEVARGAKAIEIDGLAKPVAARLMSLAGGRQTLMSRATFDLARPAEQGDHRLQGRDIRWLEHGQYKFKGTEEPFEVCEVGVEGSAPLTTPPDTEKSTRHVPSAESESADEEETTPPAGGRATHRSPQDVSEDELRAALKAHAFRLQPTAAALGISRTSLYALIDKSSVVRKARDLTSEEIESARQQHGGDLDAMATSLEVSRKGLSRRMTELGLI